MFSLEEIFDINRIKINDGYCSIPSSMKPSYKKHSLLILSKNEENLKKMRDLIDVSTLLEILCIKLSSPSLSESTQIIFNTGLTHLGSEASKYKSTILNFLKF